MNLKNVSDSRFYYDRADLQESLFKKIYNKYGDNSDPFMAVLEHFKGEYQEAAAQVFYDCAINMGLSDIAEDIWMNYPEVFGEPGHVRDGVLYKVSYKDPMTGKLLNEVFEGETDQEARYAAEDFTDNLKRGTFKITKVTDAKASLTKAELASELKYYKTLKKLHEEKISRLEKKDPLHQLSQTKKDLATIKIRLAELSKMKPA